MITLWQAEDPTNAVSFDRKSVIGLHHLALAVDGESILHKAVMMKDVLGVKILLENSADPNQVGNMGDTPLHHAAFYNNLAIVEILVRNGSNVHAKNEMDETPADLAKLHNSQALLNYLTRH